MGNPCITHIVPQEVKDAKRPQVTKFIGGNWTLSTIYTVMDYTLNINSYIDMGNNFITKAIL